MSSRAVDPQGIEWRRLDPAYLRLQLITGVIWLVLLTAVLAVPLILSLAGVWDWPEWLSWGLPAVAFVVLATDLALVPRRVRAKGYAERADDLLIRSGLMFRRVTVVPYGRMQYVDVSVGPLEGAFGLATVKLHTAAAATQATIPGLPGEEAARLREQLSARGEARLAGL